jgi:hypothetical protein
MLLSAANPRLCTDLDEHIMPFSAADPRSWTDLDESFMPLSAGPKIKYIDPFYVQTCHTDKKENQIFLIYREIQSGAVAKSYMTNGLLNIWGNIFAFPHILGSLPHI